MSWLIVLVGEQAQNIATLLQLRLRGRIIYDSPDVVIATDSTAMCQFAYNEQTQQGWAYVGCMQSMPPAFQQKFSSNESFPDGHFALVRWNNSAVQFDTDSTGLRSFYLVEYQQVRIITTHIACVTSLFPATVDFSALGSAWLLQNQILTKSIISPYKRFLGGKGLSIQRNGFDCTYFARPDFPASEVNLQSKITENNLIESFGKNIHTWSLLYPKINLSLSGGFDSRVIVALLLQYILPEKTVVSITVGEENHPDAYIAKKVAMYCGMQHKHIHEQPENTDILLQEYRQYALFSLLNKPISAFPQLWTQRTLARPDTLCFDGGFGEVWRRGFYNRLLYRGKRAILQGDIQHLTALLGSARPNIFTPEIAQQLQQSAYNEVCELYQSMPNPATIGVETWLDILALRTRLPNYYASDQAYSDAFGVNIMPFAQTSLLQLLAATPLKLRKNGTIWRKYIAENHPQLAEIPLAKGNSIVPFNRSVWRKNITTAVQQISASLLKKKSSPPKTLPILFQSLLPIIMDIGHSDLVRERGVYNTSMLHNILNKMQSGVLTQEETMWLDWWFSFELFYRGMNGQSY